MRGIDVSAAKILIVPRGRIQLFAALLVYTLGCATLGSSHQLTRPRSGEAAFTPRVDQLRIYFEDGHDPTDVGLPPALQELNQEVYRAGKGLDHLVVRVPASNTRQLERFQRILSRHHGVSSVEFVYADKGVYGFIPAVFLKPESASMDGAGRVMRKYLVREPIKYRTIEAQLGREAYSVKEQSRHYGLLRFTMSVSHVSGLLNSVGVDAVVISFAQVDVNSKNLPSVHSSYRNQGGPSSSEGHILSSPPQKICAPGSASDAFQPGTYVGIIDSGVLDPPLNHPLDSVEACWDPNAPRRDVEHSHAFEVATIATPGPSSAAKFSRQGPALGYQVILDSAGLQRDVTSLLTGFDLARSSFGRFAYPATRPNVWNISCGADDSLDSSDQDSAAFYLCHAMRQELADGGVFVSAAGNEGQIVSFWDEGVTSEREDKKASTMCFPEAGEKPCRMLKGQRNHVMLCHELREPSLWDQVLVVGGLDEQGEPYQSELCASGCGEGLSIMAPWAGQTAGSKESPIPSGGTTAAAATVSNTVAYLAEQRPGITVREAARTILWTAHRENLAARFGEKYGGFESPPRGSDRPAWNKHFGYGLLDLQQAEKCIRNKGVGWENSTIRRPSVLVHCDFSERGFVTVRPQVTSDPCNGDSLSLCRLEWTTNLVPTQGTAAGLYKAVGANVLTSTCPDGARSDYRFLYPRGGERLVLSIVAHSPSGTVSEAAECIEQPSTETTTGIERISERHGAPGGQELPSGVESRDQFQSMVRFGDTLWGLACRHYGTPIGGSTSNRDPNCWLWPLIWWDTNKTAKISPGRVRTIVNPDLIFPNQMIFVPAVSEQRAEAARCRARLWDAERLGHKSDISCDPRDPDSE